MSSLSKQVFEIQNIVAPVSNNDTVSLLLTLTWKLAAYLLSLSLTSTISCSCNSHSESQAESEMQLELSMLVLTGVSSGSVDMC